MIMKKIFIALCALSATCVAQQTTPYDSLYLKNKTYTLQTDLYKIYTTERATIVMLGNSITFGVNWNELMGRNDIANRGIGSDNVLGYYRRMESVYRLHPTLCCIEGGINDVYADISVDTIFVYYKKIIEELQAHNIIPVIQSTLYVSTKWKRYAEKNSEVTTLNALLSEYAAHHSVEFININAVLSNNALLREDITHDGVHLNAEGYTLWRDILEKIFQKYGV